ncbi:hypothetical protein FIM57_04835 [Helicobacter pylori]|nr:hypothetical protein [Helicobacter pylori]TPH68137.1 hypothetical protein FIM57_04835 [Helicobacter pylori]TPH81909.1 hypothetical protein FIM51_04960 [Helicobacter pylori]
MLLLISLLIPSMDFVSLQIVQIVKVCIKIIQYLLCENFRAVIIQRARNYFLTIKYCFNHSYICFSKPTKNAFTNSSKN